MIIGKRNIGKKRKLSWKFWIEKNQKMGKTFEDANGKEWKNGNLLIGIGS